MSSGSGIPPVLKLQSGHIRAMIAWLATIAFVVVWQFPFETHWLDLHHYVPLHTILEIFAVVIAGIIFTIGWHARVSDETGPLPLLAAGFLGVALLDVAHILSYQGMPEWFTPSGAGKAIYFWFMARYMAALTLLAFVVLKSGYRLYRGIEWLVLAGVLLWVVEYSWFVLYNFEWLPLFIVPGEGLTPFKIQLEWILTAIVLGTLVYVWKNRGEQLHYDRSSLLLALWLTCLSELCFTLYSNVSDTFNLMGHIYKVLSYGYLYHAIVVGSVKLPYKLLSQNKETLQQLTDNIPQVFWMTSPDKRKVIYISPAYESIWQRSCNELIESPRSWLDSVHPEDRQLVAQFLRSQSHRSNSIEFRIIRPDGSVRIIRSKSFPVKDEKGEVLSIAGVAEDFTSEVEAEVERQENRHLLEQTQSIAHLGSWELNLETGRLSWSDEVYRIFGVDPEKEPASYELFVESVHPEDREYTIACYDNSINEKKDFYDVEHRIIRKNTKEIRYVHEKCFHIRDESGKVVRSIGMVHDISDRKVVEIEKEKLQQQLVQAQKMEAIGHLTGGIAHDFNNMLTAISGYNELSGMMDKDHFDFEKFRHYQHEIHVASNRARELINQMLIFSRARSDSVSADTSATLVQPVIKEVIQLLRPSIPMTIDLHYQMSHRDLKVNINPIQLHQILMNLVINARDACDKYGQIKVEVRNQSVSAICSACHELFEGEYVVLSVHDSGAGIAPEIQSKIFDPFFTTKEVGKGSGMGLSVVHGMVHSQGGHIRVTSNDENGTLIEVLLRPVENDEAGRRENVEQIQPATERILAGKHIMIVDDERPVASLLSEILQINGATVSVFNDPVEALSVFKNNAQAFDLVVTDETMPGLSGLDMSRSMLELRADLPIVLCTGYSENVNEAIVKQNGIASLLSKPLSSSQLISEITGLLK